MKPEGLLLYLPKIPTAEKSKMIEWKTRFSSLPVSNYEEQEIMRKKLMALISTRVEKKNQKTLVHGSS